MQVLELMKTHVVTTTVDDTLSNALDLMDLYQVDGLPVVDDVGQLCGMLTETNISNALMSDVLLDVGDTALLDALRKRASVGLTRVGDLMTRSALSITESSDVVEATVLLLRSGRKRLPVTALGGKVVGTFNRIDVFQAVIEEIL